MNTPASRQSHTDDGGGQAALRARVGGVESSVSEIKNDFRSFKAEVSDQFAESRRQTGEQIADFRSELSSQIATLGADLRGRGTNWGWIISAVGVIIILSGAVLWPINNSLGDAKNSFRDIEETFKRFEQFYARRDDMRDDFAKLDDLISKNVTRKEHEEFAKRLDQRDTDERVEYFREIDRVDHHINQVDADQIKRPEIQALFDNMRARIDALSARQESTDRLIGSTYNFGDTIKALQASVENLQSKLFALYAQPQPVPLVPIPKN